MSHNALPPFARSEGPHDAHIALVGEAWGSEELAQGKPFVGSAGQELDRQLEQVGIAREECFLTNLIAGRPSPHSNDFSLLCASKAEVGKHYPFPPIHNGKYLRPEFFGEIERLQQELLQVKPNITVALGAKASWALLRSAAISKIRGAVAPSDLLRGLKVLPTFHPSYILQGGFSERPVVLADLLKAKREATFAEFKRPERFVTVAPTLSELYDFVEKTLAQAPAILSCDLETNNGQIESIGFADARDSAIVCPFLDTSTEFPRSYWPTAFDEVYARRECERLLASAIPKLFQNGLFDIQWLLKDGFKLRNCLHDTMLLHHSIFPELKKGLGFIGSIYTGEPSWKLMRKRAKEEELKRDD